MRHRTPPATGGCATPSLRRHSPTRLVRAGEGALRTGRPENHPFPGFATSLASPAPRIPGFHGEPGLHDASPAPRPPVISEPGPALRRTFA